MYRFVLFHIIFILQSALNKAQDIAVHDAGNTCSLVKPCFEKSDALFEHCGSFLNTEDGCLTVLHPIMTAFGTTQKQNTHEIGECIEQEGHQSTVNPKQQQNCAAMVRTYSESLLDGDEKTELREKHPHSNAWLRFYMCITNASRQRHICTQLSSCCPQMQDCSPKAHEDNEPDLRQQLFQARQDCAAQNKYWH